MSIEFKCNSCSRLLRVPNGSQGKACSCPGCKVTQTIPDEKKNDKILEARIDVPCPKCKNILQCDASLDGTRGCCPSCAHVFTISMDAENAEVLEVTDSFPFACPKCKQLFEGTSDKKGRKGKCTACGEVFVIERFIPPKPAESPSTASIPTSQKKQATEPTKGRSSTASNVEKKTPRTAPPNEPTRPVAQRAQSSAPAPAMARPESRTPAASQLPQNANMQGMDLGSLLPPANQSFATPTYTPATTYQSAPKPKKIKRANTSGGSKIGLILGIIGGLAGMAFLICGGIVAAVMFGVSGKVTLSSSGYSVDAPGTKVSAAKLPQNLNGEASGSRLTKSEFIISKISGDGGFKLTADIFVLGLERLGTIEHGDATPISRAGLNGFRYVARRGYSSIGLHTAEVYPLSGGGVLWVVYANGADTLAHQGKKSLMTADRAREWDKPDDFFASLRPSP
jgi:hypothetical protein